MSQMMKAKNSENNKTHAKPKTSQDLSSDEETDDE